MTSPCSIDSLEAALAGSLSADEERTLHHHLDECASCSSALDRMAEWNTWREEAAALLTEDELDESNAAHADWAIDFTVEHLEPSDEPNVLGRLGDFNILEIIGQGGMGVVLKAHDRKLNRYVAIKVLSPHLAQNSLARKRFTREAQAAAAVVHPNVLAIHQVQPNGRLPYLVMPLVAGESVAERLTARGTLELTETLRIGMQAAAGLAAAHEQGLVHRDVKPANILLEKGVERAVLTDFGLARAADDVTLTRWGVIAGTPQYMSPEQARGEPLDGRSDLFSLGCVLYEMATGVSPFRGDSVMATIRRLVDEPPRAMQSLNPELPPWFIAIVERLLEKDASRRFTSAKEVSALLEECLAHVQQPAVVPLPAGLPKSHRAPKTSAGGSRRRMFRNIGIAALLLLGLGGYAAFMMLTAEPQDISGQWTGDDWGAVTLKKTGKAQYAGTYTDVFGPEPGTIELKWSRIERRYNGTWSEGKDRFGKLSVHQVGDDIRGGWTTNRKSEINPGTPALADLRWVRPAAGSAEKKPIKWQFGPVVERTLNDVEIGTNSMLNLDTGAVVTPPKDVRDFEKAMTWMQSNRGDLVACGDGGGRGLRIVDGLAIIEQPADWDASPKEIVESIASMERTIAEYKRTIPGFQGDMGFSNLWAVGRGNNNDGHTTFYIKTRSGKMGTLQITGMTDEPRTVTFRYKLLTSQGPTQPANKRQRFEPVEGRANDTHWAVFPPPSFWSKNNWVVYASMTIGGAVPIQLPDDKRQRGTIKLLEGNDDAITVQVQDAANNSKMVVTIARDQSAEVTVQDVGYKVYYPSVQVAPKDHDTTPFAEVIVTRVERRQAPVLGGGSRNDVDVRLQPTQRTWKEGEDCKFTIEARNVRDRILAINRLDSIVLEMDGKAFPLRTSKLRAAGPDKQYKFDVSLSDFGSDYVGKPEPGPGKHSFVAIVLNKTDAVSRTRHGSIDRARDALAISNMVEIDIAAKKSAASTESKEPPWGRSHEGLEARLQSTQQTWTQGDAIKFKIEIRNVGSRELTISGLASLALEMDGKPYPPRVWNDRGLTPILPFGPEKTYSFNVSLKDFGSDKIGKPEPGPGKHSFVAILLNNSESSTLFETMDRTRGALAVSNTVELEIKAKMEPKAHGAALRYEYGPVIEQTLDDITIGPDSILNLEKNQLITPPDDIRDFEKAQQWMPANGGDVVACWDGGGQGLRIVDGLAMTPADWNATPKEIVETVSDSERQLAEYKKTMPGLQGPLEVGFSNLWWNGKTTFYIKTRSGRFGVLQITDLTNDPRTVSFRYKLLKEKDSESPSTGKNESHTNTNISITDAVATFNEKASKDPVGKDQPPLTEDELLGAVRWLAQNPALPDDERDQLRKFAADRALPPGWKLDVLTTINGADGERLQSWMIQLEKLEPANKKSTHLIRHQLLSLLDSTGKRLPLPEVKKPTSDADATPLAAAIQGFNDAHNTFLDIRQPPLTEDEVVAAIRWWKMHRNLAPVTNGEFAEFQKIADTRQLPRGAEFELISTFQGVDYGDFYNWSVRIRMPQSSKPGWTFAYTIREHMIRSDPIDDKDADTAWGPPSADGMQAGLLLMPHRDWYVAGQTVTPVFIYRNVGQHPVEASFPNIMTRSYYSKMNLNMKGGSLEQDERPGGPAGWTSVELAPGHRHEVHGLPILIGDGNRGKAEMAIRAAVGQTVTLGFDVPHPVRDKQQSLSTGQLRFLVVDKPPKADDFIRRRERQIGDSEPAFGPISNGIKIGLESIRDIAPGAGFRFKIEIRNDGGRDLRTSGLASIALDIDGKVYPPRTWQLLGGIPSLPFGPGKSYTFEVSIKDFGFTASDTIELPDGKHTLVAMLLDNTDGTSLHQSIESPVLAKSEPFNWEDRSSNKNALTAVPHRHAVAEMGNGPEAEKKSLRAAMHSVFADAGKKKEKDAFLAKINAAKSCGQCHAGYATSDWTKTALPKPDGAIK